MRQQIVQKQQEAKEEKLRKEIEKREAEQQELKRKSLEAEEKAKQSVKPLLTPLISPAALMHQRFGPKTFTPVSNMLAIQRAKEKVEELKRQKMAMHQQHVPQKTVAQTTAKGTGRVAHAAKPPAQVRLFSP